ncbi:MAG: glycosyltransferase family 2 protein [Spirochaetaceae bacterium]|nr:glycosyltransferase family 2 protein [Spirochaetaceae bacterium]
MISGKYVLISPCRDEAEYMCRTLDSVIAQSIKPVLWIIVDDGSTDQTPEILDKYANKHSFIKIVRRENRGHRSVGPGVIEAFYAGYDNIDIDDYEYICKLDLDLDLPPLYFEILMSRFQENPRLGTCSGKPYFLNKKGKLISEKCGDENSVGMTKMFRRNCFDQIGGFVRQVMWDAIDGHRCRMLGWIASSWDELDLRFIHLRPMGSSQNNMKTGRIRHGFGQYFMGTSFIYMSVSALYRMSRPPIFYGGLSMWWGYVKSMLTRVERLNDLAFRKFLRSYQWSCIIFGKNKATARLNEQRAQYWSPLEAGPYSIRSEIQ